MELNLSGSWRVTHIPFGADMGEMLAENFVPEGWLTATIPEDIHATLRKAGVLRGNTYGKPPEEEIWVEECDWVYFREFFVPQALDDQRITLHFEGLDTFCCVYLNGALLGSHENMFVPFCADVKEKLRYGERNVLLVRILSPVKAVAGRDDSAIFSITDSDRIFARKAQMNYGWDFCGRCVTSGIWKPVTLRGESGGEIAEYYLRTLSLTENSAELGLDITCFLPPEEDAAAYTLHMTLQDAGETVLAWQGSVLQGEKMILQLDRPKLWWPRPYGEPFLYDFTLMLEKEGSFVQTLTQRFGVRTIAVLQEPQPDGCSFRFAVNGKGIFMRGANWVPINTVYTDIREEDYVQLLDDAAEGNLSMLRIWGGGIYEPLLFYRLCEERGILVWNDFMLSCGVYPQDDVFLRHIRAEAEYVVKTYRNCTALAIWAGDNENGQAYGWAGRPYEFRQDKISGVVLKEVCAKLDPSRFYLATSPDSPAEAQKGGDNPASPYQGDTHLYIMSADPGVRGGRDYGKNYYKRIRSYKPRFVSEFGFISFPEKETFYRYNVRREPIVSGEELAEFLPFAAQLLREGRVDEAIYFSQVYQAMALKYWLEYFRSLRGTCWGTLYWKFNDPLADRPTIGVFPSHMSMVDMYGNRKMAYYATRRAYADLLLTVQETDVGWDIIACNEGNSHLPGTLNLSRYSFSGTVKDRREIQCVIPADAAVVLCSLTKEEWTPVNRFEEYLKCEFSGEGQYCENRWFFADIHEINQLALLDAGLQVEHIHRKGGKIQLCLRSQAFARTVRINILDHGAGYSDNYFDMDANCVKDIDITLKNPNEIQAGAIYLEGENVTRQVISLASILETQ